MNDLWAVHVEGPDDIIPAPSLQAAEKLAIQINESQKLLIERAPEDKRSLYPHVFAKPVLWEHGPESHAKHLDPLDF